MKRVFLLLAMVGLTSYGLSQEKPLSPNEVKKENAATAVEEKEVAAEKSEAIEAIEEGKEIQVKSDPTKATSVKGKEVAPEVIKEKERKIKKDESKRVSDTKPLNDAEVAKENAATAIEEKKVAAEKTEAEVALAEGKEIVVKDTTTYSATSKVNNSGFQRTVGFEGAWKFDMNLENREIKLTGGTLSNKGTATSNALRLMVYLAPKAFDLNNPEFIGTVYSSLDIPAMNASDIQSGQTYITLWASETNPPAGTYYPYILLGEQNPTTQEFEVKDVKAFDNPITITQ